MASFEFPPLTPDPDPAPLSPSIPLNPPMVGEASPFEHVDGENRDLILESIRAWIRHTLLIWTKKWQDYLVYWLALVAAWLNEFVVEAAAYITEHAISGYSWRTTVTPIAPTGTTTVVIVVSDPDHRPLTAGDLVSDQSPNTRYGIVTAVVDPTHAIVTPIGILQGFPGFGWWTTVTPIAHTGTTAVVLAVDPTRSPQVDDLVLDGSASAAYGKVTVVTDPTHVTVAFIGTLQGPQGIQGIQGIQGEPGVVQSVVAGASIMVDDTDPANPIVSATGSGGGVVVSVVPGTAILVDDTDTANPIVSVDQENLLPIFTDALPDPADWTGQIVFAQGIPAVDDGPYYSDGTAWTLIASGAGGGVASVVAGTNIAVDDTDPANPIVSLDTSGGGVVSSIGATDAPYNVDTPVGFSGTSADPVLEFNLITTDNGSGFTSEFGGPATHLRMKSDNTAWTNLIEFLSNQINISSLWDSDGSGGVLQVYPGAAPGDPGGILAGGILNLLQLAADPVGTYVDGAIYFNTTSNTIRVYYVGAWH